MLYKIIILICLTALATPGISWAQTRTQPPPESGAPDFQDMSKMLNVMGRLIHEMQQMAPEGKQIAPEQQRQMMDIMGQMGGMLQEFKGFQGKNTPAEFFQEMARLSQRLQSMKLPQPLPDGTKPE
jgi:hypothetical protein